MGNCLERSLSEDDEDETSQQPRHHRRRHRSYNRLNGTGSSNSSSSSSSSLSSIGNTGIISTGTSTGAHFIQLSNSNTNAMTTSLSSSPQQVFYLSPNVQRTAEQLTEEEQIKLLKRMTLVQQLPTASYDGSSKKNKECVICMIDFELNDTIKYLPCMHTFHQTCIDNWLVRSLVCPSCIEPVDALILEHMIMNNE